MSLRPFAATLLVVWAAACGTLQDQRRPRTEAEGPQPVKTAEPEHLIILHTNDIHGQILPLPATWIRDQDPKPMVGGLERIARYIDQVKRQAAADGDEVLVLDAGDWFQGTPEGGLDQGLPFMQVMAQMGYDAMCVGNHEFDHGVDTLIGHLETTPLPALLANVREESGAYIKGTQPYMLFDRAGSRIAVLGILTTGTPAITHPSASQLQWDDEAETLRHWRGELEDLADWTLLLTHMGIEEDEKLVQAVPGFPILIGGHSHTLLHKGKRVGETWITQAGSKGRGVGRIDIWIDPETRQPGEIQIQIVNLFEDTVEGGEAQQVAEMCTHAVHRTQESMQVQVAELPSAMARHRTPRKTSVLGNFITDVMRVTANGDVALQNRGGIRANWKAGPLTRRDVFSVLPFDNTLVTLGMSGQELWDFFAAKVAGNMSVEISGARLQVERDGEKWKLAGLLIGGEPVEMTRKYRFVTNNYLANGGDGMEELTYVTDRENDGRLQRDIVEQFLMSGEAWSVNGENRYEVVGAR